eukprot:TRINITY_DN20144_c0_g1_i1.p1 TRINITY_DN20144_c0_g1~~TRINITY_DN20144_c0_g1_i1.p1  ORF type:complete len:585 (+),score=103.64 TRINITY_DN20144_c0_g1_i1:48-1802(+)
MPAAETLRCQIAELEAFVADVRTARQDPLLQQYEALLEGFRAAAALWRAEQPSSCPSSCEVSLAVKLEPSRELQTCTGTVRELVANFPQPGGKIRTLRVLKALASESEVNYFLSAAREALEFSLAKDSVDQRPAYEIFVVRKGIYEESAVRVMLHTFVDQKLLPYIREAYRAPEAVLSSALIRRYLPDERRVHPTHVDGHSFCTAVLSLNPEDFEGGLYVQPQPGIKHRQFVKLDRGDVATHQYDLPHGVRVVSGHRYSLICWFKTCQRSCEENSTPWYDEAARTGDADAMAALAQRLERGEGHDGSGGYCHGNSGKAETWLRKAAELGQPEAQTNLGAIFEAREARGSKETGLEATRWWLKAAEADLSSAQLRLALAYASGTCGLELDMEVASMWMQRAAENEDSDAMNWLGTFYGKSARRHPEHAAVSQSWLRKAAEMGHSTAQQKLALAYLSSKSDADSRASKVAQAAVWLKRASNNGSHEAKKDLLGLLRGLPELPGSEEFDAIHPLKEAAAHGQPEAQHSLALLLAQGLCGVAKNLPEALQLCRQAASKRHRDAWNLLQVLESQSEVGSKQTHITVPNT